jgi:hypothetical protein
MPYLILILSSAKKYVSVIVDFLFWHIHLNLSFSSVECGKACRLFLLLPISLISKANGRCCVSFGCFFMQHVIVDILFWHIHLKISFSLVEWIVDYFLLLPISLISKFNGRCLVFQFWMYFMQQPGTSGHGRFCGGGAGSSYLGQIRQGRRRFRHTRPDAMRRMDDNT